jgi:poly(A) polymerase
MDNKMLDNGAYAIIRSLQEAGYTAYLVGGAVRDFLLGIVPKDYDISTTATPEEVKELFGRGARIIGRRFKIVHIYKNRNMYEISTFRRMPSEAERKGRLGDDGLMVWRDNEWGTPKEDAFRRDFSANALFMDPLDDNKIIDYCDGVESIKKGMVHSLGDPEIRFEEDPVRMLRALKLVGQYGFKLDPDVDAAIRKLGPKICLVSQRRLYEEILKLTYKPCLAATLEACHEATLLEYLLPEVASMINSSDGELFLKALATRDRKMVEGCSLSRAYSMALLCYRYVEKRLNPESAFGDGWESSDGIDTKIKNIVEDFFKPYPVTRVVAARVRDVILLQGRFRKTSNRNKTRRHPEFHYAWLLFTTLAETLDFDEELVEPWKEDFKLIPGTRKPRRKKSSRKKPDA